MQNSTPDKQQFKLRRVLALRKRDKTDSISIGASSNGHQSTFSADSVACASPRANDGPDFQPIQLCNQ